MERFFSGFYYTTIYFVCKGIVVSDISLRDMIYSALQNMIYAGGESNCDKISKFSYPAPPSRLRRLGQSYCIVRKISLTRNPLIYLLIRRAPRATFPDMGRLTDSLLPTIKVKTTKQFCFFVFILLLLALNRLLYFYYTVILPYRICCLIKLLSY